MKLGLDPTKAEHVLGQTKTDINKLENIRTSP